MDAPPWGPGWRQLWAALDPGEALGTGNRHSRRLAGLEPLPYAARVSAATGTRRGRMLPDRARARPGRPSPLHLGVVRSSESVTMATSFSLGDSGKGGTMGTRRVGCVGRLLAVAAVFVGVAVCAGQARAAFPRAGEATATALHL